MLAVKDVAVRAHCAACHVVRSRSRSNMPASREDEIARALRDAIEALEPITRGQKVAFERRLRGGIAQCASYEDEMAIASAMSVIPIERLKLEGHTASMTIAGDEGADVESVESAESRMERLSARDAELLALLRWFKEEFFSWVDKPPCEHCGGSEMTSIGVEVNALTAEEREGEAGRVELYRCGACVKTTRFPRYNSAIKLLETRRGRCGEWANAFTLCARAMGFRARWCLDWTDHVWTEVYSESQRRWLHCDPCENVCDKPLLYECGWGKKLSYVIAFSIEGVFDVTRRYTQNMRERYRLRGEVYEPWLRKRLAELTSELRSAMLPSEIKELEVQDVVERAELGRPAVDVGESLPGRQTGSLAWRRARGELGPSS
ncbi:Rad4/PNGase transglutaminase-like fold [Ostreococcus tauri]|uniref:Rad4/PNGase transglutaminase-like fold n=1 Tax=Ostreococcus tauri TaxID=70448 RepID=A0A096PBT2_OSTTA|nr:Rad4/PNGase transglutaminase-like fold [Ostreococcus tauri]CEG02117.1 Rad4/PNGase transglutaminase-like fold [Ostreococcus tauri]|eukprot:XP_003083027.2 Rad4/PNGase transglutaminase-like fold [Ostreococcus tauri]